MILFGTLVSPLHCYSGEKKKNMDLLQRKQEIGGWKEARGNNKIL